MENLHRLVYHSRPSIDEPAMAAAVTDILAASRRNNPRARVTGALIFNRGCFAQILEGPRPAVDTTFERIQRDARHGNVSLMEFKPVKRRFFDKWSMAFVGESAVDSSLYQSVAEETGYDFTKMSADLLFCTLLKLVVEEESAIRPR